MKYNIPLHITEEAYTSKLCCKCGSLDTKCSNRTISCKNCINKDSKQVLNLH